VGAGIPVVPVSVMALLFCVALVGALSTRFFRGLTVSVSVCGGSCPTPTTACVQVCADCYFLRDCCKCLCTRYVAESYANPSAACLRCAHPPSHHRRCPLQLRGLADENSLLGLLRLQHEVDFSLTTPGLGVPLESQLKQPIDPEVLHRNTLLSQHRSFPALPFHRPVAAARFDPPQCFPLHTYPTLPLTRTTFSCNRCK